MLKEDTYKEKQIYFSCLEILLYVETMTIIVFTFSISLTIGHNKVECNNVYICFKNYTDSWYKSVNLYNWVMTRHVTNDSDHSEQTNKQNNLALKTS